MTSNKMREEFNRGVQQEIDAERAEIQRLEHEKNEFSPKLQNLQWELDHVQGEVRKRDIEKDAREKKILILQDKFWKA